MNKILLISIFVCAISLSLQAQVKIGDSTSPVDPDAILQLGDSVTFRGLLLPRVALVSTTLSNPLAVHRTGMHVYNTATAGDVMPGEYYNDGTKWVRITDSSDVLAIEENTAWMLNGNTGTTAGINFLGTTDNQDLIFKRNNVQAGLLATDNTAFGVDALQNNAGSDNSAFGNAAGSNITTGSDNIAIGSNVQVPNGAGSNQLNIGNAIYGTTSTTAAGGSVSIGKTAPDADVKLDVAGLTQITGANTFRYVDGNQANGKILMSDANGNAYWSIPAGLTIVGKTTMGLAYGYFANLNTTNSNMQICDGNYVDLPPGSWRIDFNIPIQCTNATTAFNAMSTRLEIRIELTITSTGTIPYSSLGYPHSGINYQCSGSEGSAGIFWAKGFFVIDTSSTTTTQRYYLAIGNAIITGGGGGATLLLLPPDRIVYLSATANPMVYL